MKFARLNTFEIGLHTIGSVLLYTLLSGTAFAEERLSVKEAAAALPGASGHYWDVDQGSRYLVLWRADGAMDLYPYVEGSIPGEDAEPVTSGQWFVKEYQPQEGDTSEFVEAKNEAMRFACCFKLNDWREGRQSCWDLHQVTFDTAVNADNTEDLLPTQKYRMRREGGGQLVSYVITTA